MIHSVCEKLLAENHGGRRCRDFVKQEFWKVEQVKLFLVKQNSILGVRYYSTKNIFPFKDVLPLVSF